MEQIEVNKTVISISARDNLTGLMFTIEKLVASVVSDWKIGYQIEVLDEETKQPTFEIKRAVYCDKPHMKVNVCDKFGNNVGLFLRPMYTRSDIKSIKMITDDIWDQMILWEHFDKDNLVYKIDECA